MVMAIEFYTQEFNAFWQSYPNKKAKMAAAKAWHKNKPSLQVTLDALAWQKRQPGWTKEDGAYVPHAATWINGHRWEDEPPKGYVAPRIASVNAQAQREKQDRLKQEAKQRLDQETEREKWLLLAWEKWPESKRNAILEKLAQQGDFMAKKVRACQANGGRFNQADSICAAILALDQSEGLPN